MKNNAVWIFAEQSFGKIVPTTFQLITKAKAIVNDQAVVVVVFEQPDEHFEDQLASYGPDQILVVRDAAFKQPTDETVAATLADLAKKNQPNSILYSASVTGRSIAPRVQAKLATGLTADCLDLRFDGAELVATKPSFGDNVMCEIVCPKRRPQMATVRPNTFAAVEQAGAAEAVEAAVTVQPDTLATVVADKAVVSDTANIKNAQKVIALGRGAANQHSIKLAKQLAAKIGATIGVSRPLTDQKEFSVDQQIGQSGNTIAPDLLITLGVSGAVQFNVGVSQAKMVVAVNTDAKAPIFQIADYQYVGEVDEFLQAFLNRY